MISSGGRTAFPPAVFDGLAVAVEDDAATNDCIRCSGVLDETPCNNKITVFTFFAGICALLLDFANMASRSALLLVLVSAELPWAAPPSSRLASDMACTVLSCK